MKKWLYRMDLPTVLLALLTLVSLCFTLFSASIVSGEAATIPICGFSLTDFTPWGYVVQSAPVMIMLLTQVHERIPHKHLILFGILFVALFGYNDGIITAREWAYEVSDGFVGSSGAMMLYPTLLMAAGVMLTTHMYYTDRFAAYKREFPEDFDPDDQYYDFIAGDYGIKEETEQLEDN